MIRQRPAGAAPVVQASATALPFRAGAFDAALAVLTVHHWPDRAQGLAELRRVARDRVVILTWEPGAASFWLVDDYFPELVTIDRAIFPTRDELARHLGPVELRALPIPHDCVDGFLGAYWRRPRAYLDAAVRGAISTFSKLADVEPGLDRLRRDLDDGTWARRHAALLDRPDLDPGYRLVISHTLSPQGRGQGEGSGEAEVRPSSPRELRHHRREASASCSKIERYETPYRSRRSRSVSQIPSPPPSARKGSPARLPPGPESASPPDPGRRPLVRHDRGLDQRVQLERREATTPRPRAPTRLLPQRRLAESPTPARRLRPRARHEPDDVGLARGERERAPAAPADQDGWMRLLDRPAGPPAR